MYTSMSTASVVTHSDVTRVNSAVMSVEPGQKEVRVRACVLAAETFRRRQNVSPRCFGPVCWYMYMYTTIFSSFASMS